MAIRVQPVDPGTGNKCGVGQIVNIDSLKVTDLFSKVTDTFGKKCTMISLNEFWLKAMIN